MWPHLVECMVSGNQNNSLRDKKNLNNKQINLKLYWSILQQLNVCRTEFTSQLILIWNTKMIGGSNMATEGDHLITTFELDIDGVFPTDWRAICLRNVLLNHIFMDKTLEK